MTPQKRKALAIAFPELASVIQQEDANSLLKGILDEGKSKKGISISVDGKSTTLKGEKGDKGEQGKDGADGKDGKNGKDGLDGKDGKVIYGINGKDGKDGAKGLQGERGTQGEKGIKGVDGSPDTPLGIANKLNTLTGMIQARTIRGLPSTKDIVREIKRLKGSERISTKDIDMSDLRWHGGGLSRVTTDSTLTGSGTTANPLSVVSSGSFTGSQEKSTTVPNSVLQTFAFTHTPKVIFWNGMFQTLTDDYTVSGLSITFTGTNIPVTGDKIVNLYA